MTSAILDDETVVNVQQYVGVSAPYNFNGLVRHYFLRRASHLADLQVNLVAKGDRPEQSHELAGRVRDRLVPIAKRFGATIQVAEAPPGPPAPPASRALPSPPTDPPATPLTRISDPRREKVSA